MNNENKQTPFVFFGTPYVARDTLEIMAQNSYIPSLVVTSPDRPRGRGMQLTPTEVKEWALAHSIPVLTPEKITAEVIAEIAAKGFSYAIVVAYGKILPQALIDIFPLGILNIHYSLLPKYRGASPVESALLNGETITGVTIQKMVLELDAGDILATEEVPITSTETTPELRARLIQIGAELLVKTLPDFESGSITPVPQDHSLATKSKKSKKEDGEIDFSAPAETTWNKFRAYAEWPGTYFFIEKNGRKMRVKVTAASFKNGSFVIEKVIPEGKSEQLFSDFAKHNTLPF